MIKVYQEGSATNGTVVSSFYKVILYYQNLSGKKYNHLIEAGRLLYKCVRYYMLQVRLCDL